MTDRLRELRRKLEKVQAERDLLMRLFVYFERFDGDPHWHVYQDGALSLDVPEVRFPNEAAAQAAVLRAAKVAIQEDAEFEKQREKNHAEDLEMEAKNRALGVVPVEDVRSRIERAETPEEREAATREHLGNPEEDLVLIRSGPDFYTHKNRLVWRVERYNEGSGNSVPIDPDCRTLDEAVEVARAFAGVEDLPIFRIVGTDPVLVPQEGPIEGDPA